MNTCTNGSPPPEHASWIVYEEPQGGSCATSSLKVESLLRQGDKRYCYIRIDGYEVKLETIKSDLNACDKMDRRPGKLSDFEKIEKTLSLSGTELGLNLGNPDPSKYSSTLMTIPVSRGYTCGYHGKEEKITSTQVYKVPTFEIDIGNKDGDGPIANLLAFEQDYSDSCDRVKMTLEAINSSGSRVIHIRPTTVGPIRVVELGYFHGPLGCVKDHFCDYSKKFDPDEIVQEGAHFEAIAKLAGNTDSVEVKAKDSFVALKRDTISEACKSRLIVANCGDLSLGEEPFDCFRTPSCFVGPPICPNGLFLE